MRMKSFVIAAAFVVSACATQPTGADIYRNVAQLEQQALHGGVSWTYFYSSALNDLSRLEPDTFVLTAMAHYREMLQYSTAMDVGKITFEEFSLIRTKLEGESRAKMAQMARPTPRLRGEAQASNGSSSDLIGPLLLLGASIATLSAPAPRPPPTSCTTVQVGRTLQTNCF